MDCIRTLANGSSFFPTSIKLWTGSFQICTVRRMVPCLHFGRVRKLLSVVSVVCLAHVAGTLQVHLGNGSYSLVCKIHSWNIMACVDVVLRVKSMGTERFTGFHFLLCAIHNVLVCERCDCVAVKILVPFQLRGGRHWE